MSQFLRISRVSLPVLPTITSPISLRLIGVCSNASIACAAPYSNACIPSSVAIYDSTVILSGFKALHFREESSTEIVNLFAQIKKWESLGLRKIIACELPTAPGVPTSAPPEAFYPYFADSDPFPTP